MTERTTIRLPGDLLKQAKRKAVSEGRTLTSLIEDGLRLVLLDNPKATNPKRVTLPVSKAIGGLLPGVDLSETGSLQETEDLEYARRLRRGFQ